jgi:hypothetical protein
MVFLRVMSHCGRGPLYEGEVWLQVLSLGNCFHWRARGATAMCGGCVQGVVQLLHRPSPRLPAATVFRGVLLPPGAGLPSAAGAVSQGVEHPVPVLGAFHAVAMPSPSDPPPSGPAHTLMRPPPPPHPHTPISPSLKYVGSALVCSAACHSETGMPCAFAWAV